MTKLVTSILGATLAASLMMAQLPAPNKKGVTAGHHIFTVKDINAANAFWHAMGGTDVEWGALKMIKFPGAFFYIRQGQPSGGTEGSAVEYLGFKVKDLKGTLAKLQALGYQPLKGADAQRAFIIGPDKVKVHLVADAKLATASATDEIHIVAPKGAKEWYEKYFGTDIAGARLTFAESTENLAPTKGRALDRLGFEVADLDEKIAELSGSGSDGPGAKKDGGKSFPDPFAVAILTDPYGVCIELSQGLKQVK